MTKKKIIMEAEDWESFKSAEKCSVCGESLIKNEYYDSLLVWDGELDEFMGQSHRKCFYEKQKTIDYDYICLKKGINEKDLDKDDLKENCMFCKKPLLQKNFRDAVKDHCHVTGKYRGAAHNICNFKLRINPDTIKIPVVFHNLKGYDAHHLMQAMSNYHKEIKCIANNMEKYITLSVGKLQFIDSYNFLLGSLDSIVKTMSSDLLKITSTISKERIFFTRKEFILTNTWIHGKNLKRQDCQKKICSIAIYLARE